MTLTPAYGRDYASIKAVKADFNANKDFIIRDIMSRWDGKPTNRADLERDGVKSVVIRYKRLTKITCIKL